MARCHHDNLELDSEVQVEVAREGDILEAGQELEDIQCDKNPGHRGFIPFKDLTLADIPDGNVEIFNNLKTLGNCVVRLAVVDEKTKEVKKLGTGFVEKIDNGYYIRTNNHVVKNNQECRNCTIEFHYDSYDRSNIITSRGVELVWACPYRDISSFTFDPVPDYLKQLDFVNSNLVVPNIVIMYKNGKIVYNDSSIRYTPKHVIHCTYIDLNDPQIDTMFVEFSDDSISYLTSSYFKFQPIPSNIQDITNIEIHVDEDDGNSTVISGDVVKFGDEYVVKISEFIFQDKVKKCRLVWNGEIISRGTRLYFQPIETREFFSHRLGVDLELDITLFPTNVWVLDSQPKSRDLERFLETLNNRSVGDNMCCIGHPHGGIKMITFGRWVITSLERFNIHGRRKEVCCRKYSCKTCPGSSGSPVSWIHDLPFQCIYRTHFMGDKVEPFYHNGTLVENINMAWS